MIKRTSIFATALILASVMISLGAEKYWVESFAGGLRGWGGEWGEIWDETKDYKRIKLKMKNLWEASADEYHSPPCSAKVTIAKSPREHGIVHYDLYYLRHFPVRPGERIRVAAWFKGSAEYRLGVDFKRGTGPRDQVLDVFSYPRRGGTIWEKVVLDQEHPGLSGKKSPPPSGLRLVVPPGAHLLAVWVQALGEKGRTAYVDDIEVSFLDR